MTQKNKLFASSVGKSFWILRVIKIDWCSIIMETEKNKLSAYTLKLDKKHLKSIKLICAVDEGLKYQYELFDAALKWSFGRKDNLMAIANSKNGENRSYYVHECVDLLPALEDAWCCNTTRALYTAVVSYLNFRLESIQYEDSEIL